MFFLPDNQSLVARDGAGDRYVAVRMEVSEQLSEPFRVSAALLVHAQVERHHASSAQLLNQPLCICYRPGFDTQRSTQFVVHGHVTQIREFAKGQGELLWEVELRPWLSLLGYEAIVVFFTIVMRGKLSSRSVRTTISIPRSSLLIATICHCGCFACSTRSRICRLSVGC